MPPRAAQRPIFVTGSIRSGTTWVGRMLALSPEVAYVHEPFNREHVRPGVCDAPFAHHFQYVTAANAAAVAPGLHKTVGLRYNVLAGLAAVRSPRDLARTVRDAAHFRRHRRAGSRALIKDPIAFFSAEWLAAEFGCDVVVTIRHPAAFVASVTGLGWMRPFTDFSEQPLLMNGPLAAFAGDVARFTTPAAVAADVVGAAILQWRMTHAMAQGYQTRHPEWLFVRHEDLSRDPVAGFERVYAHLKLPFTEGIRAQIAAFSSGENPVDTARPMDVRRNSAANLAKWKQKLAPEVIDRVRRETAPEAAGWYGDADW